MVKLTATSKRSKDGRRSGSTRISRLPLRGKHIVAIERRPIVLTEPRDGDDVPAGIIVERAGDDDADPVYDPDRGPRVTLERLPRRLFVRFLFGELTDKLVVFDRTEAFAFDVVDIGDREILLGLL
jgi:hypothetical protein